MNQQSNGKEEWQVITDRNKNRWFKIAGAAALLTLGFILYRKKQANIRNALMAGSINILTSAASEP